MTSSLALAITLSCFALSTCNHEDRTVLAKTIYSSDSGQSKLTSKTAGISHYQNPNIYTPEESSR